MPLIGLTDERGKNWTFKQIANGKGTFSDPISVLLCLFQGRDKYCDFSVTELMNDPYNVQLNNRYDYFESVDSLMDRTLGTMFHHSMDASSAVLRSMGIEVHSEIKMSVDFPIVYKGKKVMVKVGGTTDLLEGDTLWDYKTATMGKLKMLATGRAKDGIIKYEQQLNSYVLLLSFMHPELARRIKQLRIRLLCRDWRAYEFVKADRDVRKYPRGAIIDVDMWSSKKALNWFKDRVAAHYAASRVSDEDLHEVGECDTWTDHRRCTDYCSMRDICHFRRMDATGSGVNGSKNNKKKGSR